MRIDYGHASRQAGFTLMELVMTLAIVSVISVASVYIVFLSLNLRDLTLSTTKTEDAVRTLNRFMRRSIVGAKSITGGGNDLYLASDDECISFQYDPTSKNVRYDVISQPGCTPNLNPVNLFFPSATKINSLVFTIFSLSTGGRQVNVAGLLQTDLPLDTYQTGFSGTYINLVDQQ